MNEGVYYYCKKCHEYFKDKEYSETLKIIGICPQCAPKDLYQKGMWKDKVRFIEMEVVPALILELISSIL